MNKENVINKLSEIFNHELTGVIRYTHYALMIFGANRLPLVQFFRQQATESLLHADTVGEHITGLGGHPPLNTENIKETHKHEIKDLLSESLQHERKAIKAYYDLLELVKDESIYLEEFARSMIGQEELHVLEVEKMLKEQ
jgi:bacterioferritin